MPRIAALAPALASLSPAQALAAPAITVTSPAGELALTTIAGEEAVAEIEYELEGYWPLEGAQQIVAFVDGAQVLSTAGSSTLSVPIPLGRHVVSLALTDQLGVNGGKGCSSSCDIEQPALPPSDGAVWEHTVPGGELSSRPALGPDGTLYVTYTRASIGLPSRPRPAASPRRARPRREREVGSPHLGRGRHAGLSAGPAGWLGARPGRAS